MHKRTLSLAMAGALLAASAQSACAEDVAKVLQDYFNDAFPHYKLTATVADGRFAPKSVWAYSDDLSVGYRNKATKGWIPVSSGLGIYPDSMAAVQHTPVPNFAREMSDSRKWGLAFALAGNVAEVVDLEAKVSAARERGYDLEFSFEKAELDWVFYLDMLEAQEANDSRRQRLRALLAKSNGGTVPPSMTVLAALKVSGAKISLVNTKSGSQGVGITAPIAELFSSLGFDFNRARSGKIVDTIEIGEPHYLGYYAKQADKNGLISSGADDLPPDPAIADFTQFLPYTPD